MQTRQAPGTVKNGGGKELNEGVARGVAVAVAVQQGRKASRNAFAPLQRGVGGGTHVFTYAYIWYKVCICMWHVGGVICIAATATATATATSRRCIAIN